MILLVLVPALPKRCMTLANWNVSPRAAVPTANPAPGRRWPLTPVIPACLRRPAAVTANALLTITAQAEE